VLQGCIDFLIGDSDEAASLRQTLVFKIVPMLNPDGVANGSYRCGLAGCDLNRQWDRPSPTLHPTIYHAKAMVQALSDAGRLSLFIDLHGHSMRQSAFFFGCDPLPPKVGTGGLSAGAGSAPVVADGAAELEAAQLRVRMLPYLFGKREPLFAYEVREDVLRCLGLRVLRALRWPVMQGDECRPEALAWLACLCICMLQT
jgi:Zinc carboxypeptidase